MAGVTPQGFVKKRLEEILADIGAAQQGVFGAALDVGTATELGQLNGTFASAVAELWELLEVAFHGFDPDAAADYLLTVLAGLTGTERRAAKASTSPVTLNLNAGATAPAGTLFARNGRPDIVFSLDADVTNSGGSPANLAGAVTCTQTGPISCPAGELTVIVNPVSGLNSVTNAADVVVGRDADSDIVLRQRRQDQLAIRGGSTVAAIKADLLDTEANPAFVNMRDVTVLENTADTTDLTTGLPGHSIGVIVDDGDTPSVANNDIAQAIFDSRAAGIASSGDTTGTATDANGDTHTESFSRATLRPVYIDLALTTTDAFPVDGQTLVKEAIVAAGADYGISDLVIALHLRAAALSVAGVIDVPTFNLDFTPSPVATANLDPGLRARATFSTTNINFV